jgi:hypothetical protein
MSADHDSIARILNSKVSFPQHGIVKNRDGSAVMVFPFLRATWELWQHNQEVVRTRKLTFRDAGFAGFFQDRWFRLLYVLNRITALEEILTGDPKGFKYIDAHSELPCWLDLFFVYIHLLADSMTVALGRLLSDAPGSFPREAKSLFGDSSWVDCCKLRVDRNHLVTLLAQNRDWYLRIRPLGTDKGIRDSIIHRLCKWQVVLLGQSDVDWAKEVRAQLEGVDADISRDEALSTIGEVMAGLFSFLTALPRETWMRREFESRDLITSRTGAGLGGRFLPLLEIDLDNEC